MASTAAAFSGSETYSSARILGWKGMEYGLGLFVFQSEFLNFVWTSPMQSAVLGGGLRQTLSLELRNSQFGQQVYLSRGILEDVKWEQRAISKDGCGLPFQLECCARPRPVPTACKGAVYDTKGGNITGAGISIISSGVNGDLVFEQD